MFHVVRVPVARLQWLRRSMRQISSGRSAFHATGEFEQNPGTHEENENHLCWAQHPSKRTLPPALHRISLFNQRSFGLIFREYTPLGDYTFPFEYPCLSRQAPICSSTGIVAEKWQHCIGSEPAGGLREQVEASSVSREKKCYYGRDNDSHRPLS